MTARVDDLLLKGFLIGERLLQRVLIRARVDDEERVTLLDEGVVLDGKLDETTADFGSELNEVRADAGVVGAGVIVDLEHDDAECESRGDGDTDADPAAEARVRISGRLGSCLVH